MTMTDEHTNGSAANPGMDENTSQTGSGHEGASPPKLPADDTSGDIEQVAAARDRGEKEPCDVCGKLILKKNLNHHKREMHGIYMRGPNKKKDKATDPKNKQPDKQPEVKEKPLTTDEIVSVVVQMRWPHHMPSHKMPALLEWRAATERFLNG